MTCRVLCVSVLALTLPTSVRAQSLGDAAARERDRRARQSPGAPSYDDYDLQKGKPPSPSPSPSPHPSPAARTGTPPPRVLRGGRVAGSRPPSPAPAVTPSPSAPAATATPEVPAAPSSGPEASEAYWRARARDLRDALGNAERQVAELEARVNALRNDLAPTNAMQASREQHRRAALGQAVADLEQAQAAVARARQALEDLEDEARRKGALPGWLRER